jgi:hypothetical protein
MRFPAYRCLCRLILVQIGLLYYQPRLRYATRPG